MIDLNLLRTDPKRFKTLLHIKDPQFPVEKLIALDQEVRELRQSVEDLRNKKNELAIQAKSGITEKIRAESKQVGVILKEQESKLEISEKQFRDLHLSTPNLPLSEVPEGGKPHNKVVREWGKKPTFSFPIKHHLDLMEQLGWVDFATATKITGSNFALYKNEGASLVYALTRFMQKHNYARGFNLMLPPVMVNEKSLEVSGNFPKFRQEVYHIPQDNLYLSPTAEVGLVNMYRDMIAEESDLPIRNMAWTSCFRREAGNYGAHERGLIRIHQFEKVELVSICQPEESENELDLMVACAESILQKLNLHYRVSLLAAQDMSFQAAKTYDIEVWLPGQNCYYEVSSASNCTDFQARRGLIRYKKAGDKKSQLTHTLNASSLALPRLMVALIETYQQKDGSINIPDILKHEGIL